MKKLILLFILLFNLLPSYRNGAVCLHSVQQVSAQAIPCPTTGGSGSCSGGFWAWLERVLDAIVQAVSEAAVAVYNYFATGGGSSSGGENYNGNGLVWTNSNGQYFNYDINQFTQAQINLINNLGNYYNQYLSSGAAGPQYYLTLNDGPKRYYNYDNIYIPVENTAGINLRIHYDGPVYHDPDEPSEPYDENDPLPTNYYDWYGDDGTTLYAYGLTYASYPETPRTFTHVIVKRGSDPVITVGIIVHGPPPIDTVKPTKVNCDTFKVNRAIMAAQMLDSLDKSAQMKRLRDSAQGSHEVSLAGYDSSGTTRYFPNSFKVGFFDHVDIVVADPVQGPNHKNVNAMVHLHEKGIDPLPDCVDLYNLINVRKNINTHMNHSFVIGGDTLVDLVMVVSDTVKAKNFFDHYKPDSAINNDTTHGILEWSHTYKGELGMDSLSMGREFDKAVTRLVRNNYPEKMRLSYAQLYMMERYDTGIKMLISTGSGTSRIFKELSPIITRDPVTGELTDLKIEICQ